MVIFRVFELNHGFLGFGLQLEKCSQEAGVDCRISGCGADGLDGVAHG